ncbi:MAG TPA: glycosyltransferase [Vitreimonas sp.]|uniref:glycosyltransferase n=1 Tax=Vitreimonas sp. TaxID=3069702 RepID=UPI002D64E8D4|nr:glycosyltransferase [Vitreimonas sp.]HYD86946.1 glycosyltransferase [Vitreimonas sp.]
MMISVVIPTLNAAAHLPRALAPLVQGVQHGLVKQVIVADAGSTDETLEIAEAAGCDIVVVGEPGRAKQMRAGASASRANWLLFLPPETALGEGWVSEAQRHMSQPQARKRAAAFRLALDDKSPAAKRVVFWARMRARVMKLPNGDQGLLISRLLYDALGGYPDLPVLEDVEIARRIGPKRLAILDSDAIASAERYRRDGYGAHALRSLTLMARYFLGADPMELAKAANAAR